MSMKCKIMMAIPFAAVSFALVWAEMPLHAVFCAWGYPMTIWGLKEAGKASERKGGQA